jgi:hypothetical protein
VTLVVSEETGLISIARQGFMSRDIPPADLEQCLRDALGIASSEESQAKATPLMFKILDVLKSIVTEDLLRKASSLAMAVGMIYLAHQDIVQTKTFTLQVLQAPPGSEVSSSTGLLQIRLPDSTFHLLSPADESQLEIEVSGTQAQLDTLLGLPGGVLDVPAEVRDGAAELLISEINWMRGAAGLDIKWAGSTAPQLQVQRYTRHSIKLAASHVAIDLANLDAHFEASPESIIFGQDSIEIEGPPEAIKALQDETLKFALQGIQVAQGDKSDLRKSLGLAQPMLNRRIAILGKDQVLVTLPITPARRQLQEIELDIIVINLQPGTPGDSTEDQPTKFVVEQTAQKARFSLTCAGLFVSDPGSPAFTQTMLSIQRYAVDHLRAYVDSSGLGPEGAEVPVRWDFPDDWLHDLFPGREDEFGKSADLDVQLLSESSVLLRPKS